MSRKVTFMNRTGTLALVSSFLLLLTACGTSVLGGGGGAGTGTGSATGVDSHSGTGGNVSTTVLDAGSAGDGGAGGGGPVTAPPPPPCARTGTDPGPADAHGHLQYGFAATWSGLAKPPYAWTGPGFPDTLWSLDVTFTPDGHYSAHCLESGCLAFYYGSDADDPSKTYALLDDLTPSGTLQVYFGPNDLNTATLEQISLSADLTQLTFKFNKGTVESVVYTLSCTN